MEFMGFMKDVFLAWILMWTSYHAGKGAGNELTETDGSLPWAVSYLLFSFFLFFVGLLFVWTALEFMDLPL